MSDPVVKYYKVLKSDGKATVTDFAWPLPSGETPGEWLSVEGKLVRCENGLHLTSTPFSVEHNGHIRGYRVFLAEFDGETDGPHFRHELVCRRVRLVREVTWLSLMSRDARDVEKARADAEKAAKEARLMKERAVRLATKEGDSPAYVLLKYVWTLESKGTSNDSWRRTNDAMRTALFLCIDGGFEFHPDDFTRFAREFRSSYWVGDGEEAYASACGAVSGNHGGNPTAVQAVEKWKGRKPFLVIRDAGYGRRSRAGGLPAPVRLYVGLRFGWHVGLKEGVTVTVTSFVDNPGPPKKGVAGQPDNPAEPYAVCCTYKATEKTERGYDGPRKVDRVFKVTHKQISEYHAAVRAARKARPSDKTPAAEADPRGGPG